MRLKISQVDWEYTTVFRIAYRTLTHSETVTVEIEDQGLVGRGEALGVCYHGETIPVLIEQLEKARAMVERGITRADLQRAMPAGGARNALDCALWDLEAKRLKRRAWELAGLQSVQPLITAFTLSVDTPQAMGEAAVTAGRPYSLLKLKLNGEEDVERVAAVRKARPDANLVVDANQAWGEQQLRKFTPHLAELGVQLIEQPLPAGRDDALVGFKSPVPLCADESCQTSASVPSLVGKYEYVNIKLDKTGGLTDALELVRSAQAAKLKLMVGCMGGSSLSMAPGFIIGQFCSVIDLDAPLLVKADVPNAIRYQGSKMFAPEAQLWG